MKKSLVLFSSPSFNDRGCYEYSTHGRFQPKLDAVNCFVDKRKGEPKVSKNQIFHLEETAERFWGLHRAATRLEESEKRKGFFFLPKLEYPITEGIWPVFSAQSLKNHLHYYHREQLDALNERTIGTMWEAQPLDVILRKAAMDVTQVDVHHAATQHFNHSLFWRCLIPGGAVIPPGFAEALTACFGSLDKMIELFTGHCERMARYCGSGWVFLVWAKEKFEILSLPSPGNSPIAMDYVPLFVVDMFEHSYMPDYGDDVAKYVRNFFRALNWSVVNQWWNSCPK